jgi:uncharacterized alkaline shock family protein YloU
MAARALCCIVVVVCRAQAASLDAAACVCYHPACLDAREGKAPMTMALTEPADRPTAAPGKVIVSARAIGSVAYQATLGCYGMVELVPQGLRSRVGRRFGHPPPPDARDGIAVQMDGDRVTITLHVVVEYGLPIAAVAHNAIRTVYFAIEQAFALRPVAVNVHVHGLRFSGEQGEQIR